MIIAMNIIIKHESHFKVLAAHGKINAKLFTSMGGSAVITSQGTNVWQGGGGGGSLRSEQQRLLPDLWPHFSGKVQSTLSRFMGGQASGIVPIISRQFQPEFPEPSS